MTTIQVRTWFQRLYGNSYFVARAVDDTGKVIAQLPFGYGNLDVGIEEVLTVLEKTGAVTRTHTRRGKEPAWQVMNRHDIGVNHVEVRRKADLNSAEVWHG